MASGKTAFAKQLATDLDMHYVPDADLDEFLINPYGFDRRQLDPLLPENARSFDTKDFLTNPRHVNVASYQVNMCKLK